LLPSAKKCLCYEESGNYCRDRSRNCTVEQGRETGGIVDFRCAANYKAQSQEDIITSIHTVIVSGREAGSEADIQ